MEFLTIFLVIAGFVGMSFLLMNIGYLIRKREFRGTCSSNNPMLTEKLGTCSVCGKQADEACKMPADERNGLRTERV